MRAPPRRRRRRRVVPPRARTHRHRPPRDGAHRRPGPRARRGRRLRRTAGHVSTTDIPVDVDVLREEIRKTYTDVSTGHEQQFIFPTGRAWAQALGYPEPELTGVPDATVESFAGVANHWLLGPVEPGSVVLDLGCGAGTDLLSAAPMPGSAGPV